MLNIQQSLWILTFKDKEKSANFFFLEWALILKPSYGWGPSQSITRFNGFWRDQFRNCYSWWAKEEMSIRECSSIKHLLKHPFNQGLTLLFIIISQNAAHWKWAFLLKLLICKSVNHILLWHQKGWENSGWLLRKFMRPTWVYFTFHKRNTTNPLLTKL